MAGKREELVGERLIVYRDRYSPQTGLLMCLDKGSNLPGMRVEANGTETSVPNHTPPGGRQGSLSNESRARCL